MTPAQTYLAKRQSRYPPCYPRRGTEDRAQQMYRVLAPTLPQELHALVSDGSVAIGEVGRYVPDVSAIPVSNGGFVIEFTTGMMDFDYAVGRAAAGIHVGHAESGPENAKATDLETAVSLISSVFDQWKKHTRWAWLWRPGRIKHAEFRIAQDVREWIETIVTFAEAFMLAHELGHVAINRTLRPRITANDEENADTYGLQFFLPAAEKRIGRRMAYATPIFALLLFDGLERIGVRFSAEYPPNSKRIELLREQIRSRCPSTQYYHEAITIMVSYQDMMDDIIRHIDKRPDKISPDVERTIVRLIAQLIEVGKGGVAQATFIEDFMEMAGRIPAATMQEAAQTLIKYYVPPHEDEAYLSIDVRILMAAALVAVIDVLPQPMKAWFR